MKVFLFLITLVSFSANAESSRDAWTALVGEKFSGRPMFQYVENDAELPNVLIYGDSISIHYTQRVRDRLEARANVYRIFQNGGDSSSFIGKMTRMHEVMTSGNLDEPWTFEWDVIHFNVGLHDLKFVKNRELNKKEGTQVTSLEQYKQNLHDIIGYLKALAPNATLIFATTTPVPEKAQGRFVGDSVRYNAAALVVLADYPGIEINDLYQATYENHSEWWVKPGNVHFNDAGKTAQGDLVADRVSAVLERMDSVSNSSSALTRH